MAYCYAQLAVFYPYGDYYYYYYYYYYQCTDLSDTVMRTMQGHFTNISEVVKLVLTLPTQTMSPIPPYY